MLSKTQRSPNKRDGIYITLMLIAMSFIVASNQTEIFAIGERENTRDINQQSEIPFLLPFKTPTQNANDDGGQPHQGPVDEQTASSLSAPAGYCSGTSLIDPFDTKYSLADGQTSPNGKWKNEYNGYGSSGVKTELRSTSFFLSPKPATSPQVTSAALVKSTDTFCNFNAEFDIMTVKQLRQNSPPNSWEVGWFVFRYTDTFHYYWLLVKPNGIELGKKDCDTCTDPVDGQKFLVTKSDPKLKINSWSKWKFDVDGNRIQVFVDGIKAIDYTDTTMSEKLASGQIAMYSEDAYVKVDNMRLVPK